MRNRRRFGQIGTKKPQTPLENSPEAKTVGRDARVVAHQVIQKGDVVVEDLLEAVSLQSHRVHCCSNSWVFGSYPITARELIRSRCPGRLCRHPLAGTRVPASAPGEPSVLARSLLALPLNRVSSAAAWRERSTHSRRRPW